MLNAKVKELEAECEDVRQRTMKGNLFPNSPHSSQATSLFLPKGATDSITGVRRKETPVSVQEHCSLNEQ